jgi:hypothetical protein
MTKSKFPRTIARVTAAEGDPDGKPMTLGEAILRIEADQARMLRDIQAQIEAHFEREAGATEH